MNIAFHNSHYSRVVSSIVIFFAELSCWHKSYSNKTMLLLGWSLRYTILLSSSRIGWPLRTINSSSDNGTFALWVELYPLSPTRHFPDLAMRYLAGVVYEIGTAYPSQALGFNPEFLVGGGGGVAHVFSFLVSCAQCFLCHWIVYFWMSNGFHWRFL
jgi:hypothetical protein